MEAALGISESEQRKHDEPANDHMVQDLNATTSDIEMEAEESSTPSTYARLYFEPVQEGNEPILDDLLKARQENILNAKSRRRQEISMYPSTVVRPREGKAAFKFVDVGLRFFDKRSEKRRTRQSEGRRINRRGQSVVVL